MKQIDFDGLKELHQKALPVYKKAGDIALVNFNKTNDFQLKNENGLESVVTSIDKALDKYLTTKLLELLPGSGYVSEESGAHLSDSYNWVIDPLDGTANYQKGVDLWGIFIALKKGKVTVYAAMLFPTLMNKIYYGFKGYGVFRDDYQRLQMAATTGYKVKYSVDSSDPEFKKRTGLVEFGFRTSVMQTGSIAFNAYCILKGAYDFMVLYNLASYDIEATTFLANEMGYRVIYYDKKTADVQGVILDPVRKVLICKPDIYKNVSAKMKSWMEDYEER